VGGRIRRVRSFDPDRWVDARCRASTTWVRLRSGHDQRSGQARCNGSLGDDVGTRRPRRVPYHHRVRTQARACGRSSSPRWWRCRDAVRRGDTSPSRWKFSSACDCRRHFVPRSWCLADLCCSPSHLECLAAGRRFSRCEWRASQPRRLVRRRIASESQRRCGARGSRSPGDVAAHRGAYSPAGSKALFEEKGCRLSCLVWDAASRE
jgi:hypothetical protein